MQPDTTFVKRLKEIDEFLNVGWNHLQDRWQIVRDDRRFRYLGNFEGKPLLASWTKLYLVFTVQNDDGSYRPLDQRSIDKLHQIDMQNKCRTSEFMRQLELEEDEYKEKQSRRQSEQIEELTKENFHQIQDGIEAMSYGSFRN